MKKKDFEWEWIEMNDELESLRNMFRSGAETRVDEYVSDAIEEVEEELTEFLQEKTNWSGDIVEFEELFGDYLPVEKLYKTPLHFKHLERD